MSSSSKLNALVGSTTRYIAGRNAMQTVYWRSLPYSNGKMLKYNKTCEFDPAQKLPQVLRTTLYNNKILRT